MANRKEFQKFNMDDDEEEETHCRRFTYFLFLQLQLLHHWCYNSKWQYHIWSTHSKHYACWCSSKWFIDNFLSARNRNRKNMFCVMFHSLQNVVAFHCHICEVLPNEFVLLSLLPLYVSKWYLRALEANVNRERTLIRKGIACPQSSNRW